jgi:hypothetical protein
MSALEPIRAWRQKHGAGQASTSFPRSNESGLGVPSSAKAPPQPLRVGSIRSAPIPTASPLAIRDTILKPGQFNAIPSVSNSLGQTRKHSLPFSKPYNRYSCYRTMTWRAAQTNRRTSLLWQSRHLRSPRFGCLEASTGIIPGVRDAANSLGASSHARINIF